MVTDTKLVGKHTRCACGLAAVLHGKDQTGTCILTPEAVIANAEQEAGHPRGKRLRRH